MVADTKASVAKVLSTRIEPVRDYELVIIIRPELAKERVEAIVSNVNRIITTQGGGALSATEVWGKRKLAYPIKHSLEGYYILFKFSGAPMVARRLNAELRLSEELLRYMVVNCSGK